MYAYCFEVEIGTIKSKTNYPNFRAASCSNSTRLKNTIVNEIPIDKENKFLWTDTEIVLKCLHNNDTNFGVYIDYRIHELIQLTDQNIAATSKQNVT